MTANMRSGLRAGFSFGVIVIFLTLIGFSLVGAELISSLRQGEATAGTPTGFLIFMGLLGLWAGSISARPGEKGAATWPGALVSGAATGVACGLLAGVFAFILALFQTQGIDLRYYLPQMSPEVVSLFTLGQAPLSAALIHLGFFVAVGVVGALLAHALGSIHWRQVISSGWGSVSQPILSSSLVKQARSNTIVRYMVYAVLLIIVFLIPGRLNTFWNYTLGTVGIYVLMALGLNIVVGLAGLLDLGYVVFFAVGAYTMALLTAPAPHHLLWSFWVVIPIGIVLASTVGVLLGIPVLRMRGDYLAIVTLGFGEIIRVLMKSDALTSFSRGPKGVPAIGQPSLFGQPFNSDRDFMYLIIIGVLLVMFVTDRLQHSRVGRSWIAIREDETVAQAMGINTLYYKLLAFGIGAAFAGLGGALFASRNQFTGPEDHTLMVSINVLACVIVGGMGSIPGVILGSFALKGLPEILRELEIYRILTFGALLVAMMILRPQGIWPSAQRRLEMHLKDEELTEELETQPSGEGTK